MAHKLVLYVPGDPTAGRCFHEPWPNDLAQGCKPIPRLPNSSAAQNVLRKTVPGRAGGRATTKRAPTSCTIGLIGPSRPSHPRPFVQARNPGHNTLPTTPTATTISMPNREFTATLPRNTEHCPPSHGALRCNLLWRNLGRRNLGPLPRRTWFPTAPSASMHTAPSCRPPTACQLAPPSGYRKRSAGGRWRRRVSAPTCWLASNQCPGLGPLRRQRPSASPARGLKAVVDRPRGTVELRRGTYRNLGVELRLVQGRGRWHGAPRGVCPGERVRRVPRPRQARRRGRPRVGRRPAPPATRGPPRRAEAS